MGIWVHAVCKNSVAEAVNEFDSFFDSLDLSELEIELGGVPEFDPKSLRTSLRVELGPPLDPPFDAVWCAITYGDGPHEGCSIDRFVDRQQVSELIGELCDEINDHSSAESRRRILNVGAECRELVSARLPTSASDTFLGLLAREAMIWLAEIGDGLAVFDNHWFDPTLNDWLD